MATRTFRGTTNSDWNTANNWLEGAVPIAGDDVILDALSPSCTLSDNTANLNSFIATDFINTFALGNYDIIIYYAQIVYVGFNAGISGTYTTTGGKIQHFSNNAYSTNNYAVIKGNNTTLQTIDAYFISSSYNRGYSIGSNFYCKDFIENNTYGHSFYSSGTYIIYVYGNLTLNNLITNTYYFVNFNGCSLYLQGTNKVVNGSGMGNIQFYTGSSILKSNFIINGSYTLNRDLNMLFYINNMTLNDYLSLTFNGTLVTNNYYIRISQMSYLAYNNYWLKVNFGTNAIDKLQLMPYYIHIPMNIMFNNFTVNNELTIIGYNTMGSSLYYYKASDATNTITLGTSCNYYILNSSLQNLIFSRPIKGWNCVYDNCTNISNILNPQTIVSVN